MPTNNTEKLSFYHPTDITVYYEKQMDRDAKDLINELTLPGGPPKTWIRRARALLVRAFKSEYESEILRELREARSRWTETRGEKHGARSR